MSTNFQLWVDRIRAGDVRALARAISTVEDNRPESRDLLKALFNFTGRARVIGLTGAPGAGKSTLVDQLAREYRKQERTVGILAVDPTSPYTGGAILVTASACNRIMPIRASTSGAWPHAATWVAWRAQLLTPPPCSTPPEKTLC